MRINKANNTITDDNGNIVVSNIRATTLTVDQDVMMVKFGPYYAAFNVNGTPIISFDRNSTSMKIGHNLVAYKVDKSKWGVVDKDNNEILEEKYQKIIIKDNRIYGQRGSYVRVFDHFGSEAVRLKSNAIGGEHQQNTILRVQEGLAYKVFYEICPFNDERLENTRCTNLGRNF